MHLNQLYKTSVKLVNPVLVLLLLVNGYVFRAWHSQLSSQDTFEIHFLDVGQGDATLIKSPDNLYMLIDGGRGTKVLSELGDVMLGGQRNLELVVATHPDADHIEGLIPVLENYQVKNILWQKLAKKTDQYLHMQSVVKELAVKDFEIRDQDDFWLGCCVYFNTIWPRAEDRIYAEEDANSVSYAFEVSFMGKKIFLGGDILVEQEISILDKVSEDTFIYKANHHGSDTSSGLEFVSRLSPEYTVVSSGENNSYGHPHQSVLDTFAKVNTQVFRTDQQGRISFIYEDNKWKVITEK